MQVQVRVCTLSFPSANVVSGTRHTCADLRLALRLTSLLLSVVGYDLTCSRIHQHKPDTSSKHHSQVVLKEKG